ncbi:pyruvate dehydrogenase (acetyl-transferring) E1 component subunit alpha [Candidatus Woesearchaeota archaeon]|nr:pyruvate dehydrogenase (acetyl-transferring) E1 component subunit alpha [Candidatus Woesearchaeota archaeon]
MVEKVLKSFSVKFLQVLGENGRADKKLMPRLSQNQLVGLYSMMVLCRRFDEKALVLQRQGRLGTYASFLGQEAAQVGMAYALGGDDWVFPTYRDSALLIARKQPMVSLLQYFGGDERGSIPPRGVKNFPIAIPVGTQGLHAVGAAMAATIQKRKYAAVACLGDGASSEGDMSEAMNFAGVFKAPVVFLCQNNQYAISVPVKQQTASETIAQKAIAFGFEGVRVDGNDVLAVYSAAADAVKKAYAGKGPTLIECFTYRIGNHTTSDDASKYRPESEVAVWRRKDPVLRLRKFLVAKKLWNDNKEKQLLADVEKQVSAAVAEYEKIPAAAVDDVFRYTYSEMPQSLKEQLDDYRKLMEGK